MGDINRDPELDRGAEDPGTDLAERVESRGDDFEAAGEEVSPREPAGVEDGVSGTAGEATNHGKAAHSE
jgi:hypothetical protein